MEYLPVKSECMSSQDDPLAPAVQTAHEWLNDLASRLGDDRAFAHRVLRAWLHTVRDRIGVAGSAHLAAQLPELLRGVYYEGWVPSRVPLAHRTAPFLTQFALEAGVAREQVAELAGVVTDLLADRFSGGQLDGVFAVLPASLREILSGTVDGDIEEIPAGYEAEPDRVAELEQRVRLLGDAVAALARGLEDLPIGEPGNAGHAAAAQQAHRILMAERLTTATGTHLT